MTLPVVWLPVAATELHEAVSRYASIQPELGLRFVQAVEETVEAIANAPLLHAVVKDGRRRAGVKRFPYGLFFLAEENRIVILACFHGKRSPKHWGERAI